MKPYLMFFVVGLFSLQGVFAAEPQSPGEAPYTFTFNGQSIEPGIISLQGDPEQPRPGDVALLGGFSLTLGQERTCNFIGKPENPGLIFFRLKNGQEQVVGAVVQSTFDGKELKTINPLDKLSPKEIAGLWGIYLNQWPEGIAEKLKLTDPARLCVTLSSYTADKSGNMPELPEATRYLNIEENSNVGIRNYDALAELTKLQFLMVRAMTAESFDAEQIAQNKDLHYLCLWSRSLLHPEALERLERLTVLDLSGIRNLDTVAFVAKMPNLRKLDIRGTAVTNLAPLGGLKQIEEVDASMSPIKILPDGAMPALKTLEVFSTPLSESAVAAFAKLNPKCNVLFHWDEALRSTLASATRMRIRSGGTCHRNPQAEKTLWELSDPEKIRDFAKIIRIDESQSGFECQCCGDPTFEFYQGNRLIAMVGFHHGRSLRWPGRWPGDALLTPECQAQLPQWLADHGFDTLQKAREAEQAANKQQAKRRQRFLSFYPESARKFFDEESSSFQMFSPGGDEENQNPALMLGQAQGKKIARAVGDPVKLALATFGALGSVDGAWSSSDSDQRMALAAGKTIGGDDFLKALNQIRGKTESELGAARMFFWERYSKKIPEADRAAWAILLAKTVLEKGNDVNKSLVLRYFASIKDPQVASLLKQVAHGELGKEVNRDNVAIQEPGLRPMAFLILARQGNQSIRPEIEKLLPATSSVLDRAALELCLALLGDPKYLRREHFKIPSFTIGTAAIQAIENFGGREGLDILVENGLEHPFYAINEQAFFAIQRITGQSWIKNPAHERVHRHYDDLKKWWKQNGEEFVKQQRKKK